MPASACLLTSALPEIAAFAPAISTDSRSESTSSSVSVACSAEASPADPVRLSAPAATDEPHGDSVPPTTAASIGEFSVCPAAAATSLEHSAPWTASPLAVAGDRVVCPPSVTTAGCHASPLVTWTSSRFIAFTSTPARPPPAAASATWDSALCRVSGKAAGDAASARSAVCTLRSVTCGALAASAGVSLPAAGAPAGCRTSSSFSVRRPANARTSFTKPRFIAASTPLANSAMILSISAVHSHSSLPASSSSAVPPLRIDVSPARHDSAASCRPRSSASADAWAMPFIVAAADATASARTSASADAA